MSKSKVSDYSIFYCLYTLMTDMYINVYALLFTLLYFKYFKSDLSPRIPVTQNCEECII